MLLTIVIFILVLSVLVVAHEFGHFFTARRLGVKCEEFGIGFPPRAFGIFKNKHGKWRFLFGTRSWEELEKGEDSSYHPAPKSTIYSINWLPLGGFVKIKGENGEGRNDSDSFAAKKIWQRIVILSAGVIMNVLLAWVLFSVGYMIGIPQSTDTVSKDAIVSESSVMIASVVKDSPAAFAGLKEGDAILRINNELISNEKSLQDAVAANDNQVATLSVKRGSENLTIMVSPSSKDGGRATIGVSIFAAGTVRYPFFSAIIEGAKTTGFMIREITFAFGGLISNIFQGQKVSDQLAGPIGMANITGQAARLGFAYLLQFTALLSINLAVINIIPFPALDGGRILFLLIEKLKGKPVKQEVEVMIHNIGFILLITLIIFITYKDIAKLF
ncbi:MAG: RIP metalloprotease RseP [Patescibacteria group bacterium]